MQIDPEVIAAKLAGVVGSALSLSFVKGTWPERLVFFLGGCFVSYHTVPWFAAKTGIPEGLAGLGLGLFGMSICAKVWESIQTAPIAELWKALIDVVKRKLGA